MIFVQPHSGLANRIRVIVSAINLSIKNEESISILWSNDNTLACNFNDIFEINGKFKVINISLYTRLLSFIRSKELIRKTFFYFFRIRNYLLDAHIPFYVWATGTNDIDFNKFPQQVGNKYIYTCHEFYFDKKLLQLLNPTIEIKNRIRENTLLFASNTIGVHIRRADHKESIENSPLELFTNAIKNEIVKDNNAKFYLATDDIQTEKTLIEFFGNKIITTKKIFDRTSKEGVVGAMVDLYSLAATNKIYGSYYSSFSDIASRIGDIPLLILKN